MAWLRRPTCQAGNSAKWGEQWLAGELFGGRGMRGLNDLAGAKAARADVDPLDAAADNGTNPLDVRVPPTLCADVGVADAHAERRLLVADLTYRGHDNS